MPDPVRREYDSLAAHYDRRWGEYNRRSLGILRPWLEGWDVGALLDVGCGTGNLAPLLVKWRTGIPRYAGMDGSPEMLVVARGKLASLPVPSSVVAADAGTLPFADAAFDTAVCASILHAIADPDRALAEIRRVLRPGGRLLLLDWSRDSLPMRLLNLAMRLRRLPYTRMYSSRELIDLLEGAGFHVERTAEGAAGGLWYLTAIEARS